jgi:hypothetical protein
MTSLKTRDFPRWLRWLSAVMLMPPALVVFFEYSESFAGERFALLMANSDYPGPLKLAKNI